MKKMSRQPVHPGKIVKEDYLVVLSITVKDMASKLGVSRKTLSKIINLNYFTLMGKSVALLRTPGILDNIGID